MTDRAFTRCVAALAILRIVPAVVVLAANGRSLPLLPGARYGPPNGDTYGFYAAAREFIASWRRLGAGGLAAVALVLVGGGFGVWRLRRSQPAAAVVVAAAALGVVTSAVVVQMAPSGAGAVGWPIAWSLPLFPLRATGTLSYHRAYYLGALILLAANAATVVATALVARRLIPGRLALLPPTLLVLWPFVMRLVEGTRAAVYGAWLVDAGVALYSEPLSTALVTLALAAIVLRRHDATFAAAAGAAMALATAVRVSNATVAVVLFAALLVGRLWRSAATYAAAGIALLTIAISFWSRGYGSFGTGTSEQAPDGLFSWHYVIRSWRDSTVYDWKLGALLLPLPVLGTWAIRHRSLELVALAGTVVVTAAFYSLYYITALHPRFLFVALPALFVIAGIGAERVLAVARSAADA